MVITWKKCRFRLSCNNPERSTVETMMKEREEVDTVETTRNPTDSTTERSMRCARSQINARFGTSGQPSRCQTRNNRPARSQQQLMPLRETSLLLLSCPRVVPFLLPSPASCSILVFPFPPPFNSFTAMRKTSDFTNTNAASRRRTQQHDDDDTTNNNIRQPGHFLPSSSVYPAPESSRLNEQTAPFR